MLPGAGAYGLLDAEGSALYAPLVVRVQKGTPSDAETALASIHSLAQQRDGEADWVIYGTALIAAHRATQACTLFDELMERFGSNDLMMVGSALAVYQIGNEEMRDGTLRALALIAQHGTTEKGREFARVSLEGAALVDQALSAEADAIAQLRAKAEAGTASSRDIVRLGRLLLEADYLDPDAGLRFEATQRLLEVKEHYPDDAELLAVLAQHLGRLGAAQAYYDSLDELAAVDPTAELVHSPPELDVIRATPSEGLETRMLQAVMSILANEDRSEAGAIVHTAGLKAAYFPRVPGLRVAYAVGLALIGEHGLALQEAENVVSGGTELTHTQHFNLATVFRMEGRTLAARGQAEQALQAAKTESDREDAMALLAELVDK